jgi:hypothetical protein
LSFEPAIAIGACTLIGAGLLICGLYQRSRLRASQSWPQVPGTVIKSGVEVERSADSTSYALSVHYDYAVNSVHYTGTRTGFGRRSYVRQKRAQAEAERYPVNSQVTVWFDPAKPENAVLARESPGSILMIALGAGLLALVLVMLISGGAALP